MSVHLLAIDTSSERCSVALLYSHDGSDNHGEIQRSGHSRKHASEVLPMVDALLSAQKLSLKDIDAIAMISGPGSFTGLRIGAAVVQGLAFGAALPVVGVSSLAVLAHAAARQSEQPLPIVTCVHAREDEYYLAVYQEKAEASGMLVSTPILNDQLADSVQVTSQLATLQGQLGNGWIAAGSGWSKPALAALAQQARQTLIHLGYDAQTLAEIAVSQLHNRMPPSQALPVYLKEDMAYRKAGS